MDKSLLALFSGKQISQEWQRMMKESHRRIEEETSLDFDWDIEEDKVQTFEDTQYEPLNLTKTDDTENKTDLGELDEELLNLFA